MNDIQDKFLDCIEQLRKENEKIRKVVMHEKVLYQIMNEYVMYPPHPEDCEKLFGYNVEGKPLGLESIDDFLIFTNRRVVHSDMLEKNFVEDLDVEELLHETNQRIDDRDT